MEGARRKAAVGSRILKPGSWKLKAESECQLSEAEKREAGGWKLETGKPEVGNWKLGNRKSGAES